MEKWQGKHFSITDPEGVNTVIYQINKTPKQYLKEYPKYTFDRLDYTEELRENSKKKTFYVEVAHAKNLCHLNLIVFTLNKKKKLKILNIHQTLKDLFA